MSAHSDRVADQFARVLHAAGIRHAFGMPGGEVITFVDALERAGIRFVLARNETAAAMMAAGTCMAGLTPGLLVTTLGPGLANAVNGIADAAQERMPLIVVSGVVEHALRGRYTHQILDQRSLLAPLVKASFEAEAASVEAVAARAVRLALSMPFGPVHIDLSPALAAEPAGRATHTSMGRALIAAPAATDTAVSDIRQRLLRSERPLVVAGFEAARSPGSEVFTRIAGEFRVPVITTYKGKGLIDEAHPLSLGSAGLSPIADRILLPLLRKADLVLLAGYDAIEMRPGWLDPVGDPARLVEIGAAVDHGMHEAGTRLIGPVGETLAAILDGLAPRPVWAGGEIAVAREALRAAFSGPAGWGPHAIFETLQQVIPPDAILTIDSGAHRILLSQRWRAGRPLSVRQSAGWCTMGSAVPLAIGSKLAEPDRPVVAVLGDGGFEMTLGELGTLRDQGLAVTLLVLQDESLELIALKQDQAQLPRRAVALGPTDYVALAQAFGGTGIYAETAESLRAALLAARDSQGFTVIGCRISAGAYLDQI